MAIPPELEKILQRPEVQEVCDAKLLRVYMENLTSTEFTEQSFSEVAALAIIQNVILSKTKDPELTFVMGFELGQALARRGIIFKVKRGEA